MNKYKVIVKTYRGSISKLMEKTSKTYSLPQTHLLRKKLNEEDMQCLSTMIRKLTSEDF